MDNLAAEAAHLRNRIRNSPTIWYPHEFAPMMCNYMKRNIMSDCCYRARAIQTNGEEFVSDWLEARANRTVLACAIRNILKLEGVSTRRKALQLLAVSRESRYTSLMDWTEFFEERLGEYVHECNDCGHRDMDDNGRAPYNGDHEWVCDSCINDNYTYSHYSDMYVHNDDDCWSDHFPDDDDDDDREEDDEELIGGRHSSKRILKHIPSAFDSRKPQIFLGMELEVEIKDNYSRNSKAQELYDAIEYHQIGNKKHKYIHIEDDGSLNRGFEMVTGWTGLDVHREKLKFFQAPWQGVRSHDTRTCGLHVHVSKADMTLFHGAKLSMFIHESGNQKLIRAIARRDNANYAKIVNKKASYQWLRNAKRGGNLSERLRMLNEERHEALNFYNDNTVEFRLFKGTLRYETQMACLEFAYMSWFFSRDTGVGFLTTDEFIKYICKNNNRGDTRFLRRYLKEKGFVLPKSAVVKDNPRVSDAPLQPIEEKIAE